MPSPTAANRHQYTASARAAMRAGTKQQRPMPKPPRLTAREAIQSAAMTGLKAQMRKR
jgi:hypothetical protein